MRISSLRTCLALGLATALVSCNGQPSGPLPSPNPRSSVPASEPVLATQPPPSVPPGSTGSAVILGFENGILRVQSDAIAYAPLADASLSNESDPDVWRRALPESMQRTDNVEESWWGCDDGDRVVRFRDTAQRNQVQLRTCLPDADTALMVGFMFHDNLVALAHGLALGDARDRVLDALGLPPADLPEPAGDIRELEVVNEEDNTTVRFHFDAAGILARVDYEPYTG